MLVLYTNTVRNDKLRISERKWPRGCGHTPGPGPQKGWLAVDTNILRSTPDKVAPDEETPHAYMDGWVFLGFEAEDEDGEHVEVIERVACKRCRQERR